MSYIIQTNIDEDIESLSYSQLTERKILLSKDLDFVNDKEHYWSEWRKQLTNFRNELTRRQKEIQRICEICKEEDKSKDKLRSLPDGTRVCKKCWKSHIDDVKLKNYNNAMRGGY